MLFLGFWGNGTWRLVRPKTKSVKKLRCQSIPRGRRHPRWPPPLGRTYARLLVSRKGSLRLDIYALIYLEAKSRAIDMWVGQRGGSREVGCVIQSQRVEPSCFPHRCLCRFRVRASDEGKSWRWCASSFCPYWKRKFVQIFRVSNIASRF